MFETNKNRVYDYACRMLKNRDSAQDITQEAFIRLYNNLNSNSNINNPQNWLFIITRNLCLNKIRDSKREVSLEKVENSDALIYNCNDPKHLLLQKALNSLETKYREALILKEYYGFSYIEISEIMKTSVSAIRALLYKARIQLKDNFEGLTPGGENYVL